MKINCELLKNLIKITYAKNKILKNKIAFEKFFLKNVLLYTEHVVTE